MMHKPNTVSSSHPHHAVIHKSPRILSFDDCITPLPKGLFPSKPKPDPLNSKTFALATRLKRSVARSPQPESRERSPRELHTDIFKVKDCASTRSLTRICVPSA